MLQLSIVIPISILLLLSTRAEGQILITADTISFDCRDQHTLGARTDKFLISSQDEYEQSEFFTAPDNGCLPFVDIDFEKNVLIGFKYRGSNCDRQIKWSTVIEKKEEFVIQFSTGPPHVCRDLSYRIAWFILSKPQKDVDIVIERVWNK